MGRLWHTLILAKWDPLFFWLPFESYIYKQRSEYYDAFQSCRKTNDSQLFIELLLEIIKTTLLELKNSQ
jgi:Fic family protein